MAGTEFDARIQAEKLAKARAATERINKASADKAKDDALKKVQADIIAKRNAAQTGAKVTAVSSGSLSSARMSGMGIRPIGPAAAQGQKATVEYTVKKGDTLSQIAKNYYGFATQPYWKLIQDANKDIIKDANLIYPGQVFKIPELPEAMKKK
jgi:nucleoid-associated protein YgaU